MSRTPFRKRIEDSIAVLRCYRETPTWSFAVARELGMETRRAARITHALVRQGMLRRSPKSLLRRQPLSGQPREYEATDLGRNEKRALRRLLKAEFGLLHAPRYARSMTQRCRAQVRFVVHRELHPQPEWMRALETDSLGVDLLEGWTWLR